MNNRKILKNIYFSHDFLKNDILNEFHKISSINSNWVLTTNYHYKKIKNNNNIEKRKREQILKFKNGDFAYLKSELKNDIPFIKLITEKLNSIEVLNKIKLITGCDNITRTSDVFVSRFSPGDFLSEHTDINLGKYAFIIFLNKTHSENDGGRLFIKNEPNKYTIINPEYNKIVLFNVQDNIPHYVETSKKNRYAITGWYV